MQPIADEFLKSSGLLLMSLQKYAATHAPRYRRTVDATLQAEGDLEALSLGHDAPEPAPRKQRGHVKHRLLVAWDAALAGSESILQVASLALGRASKALFRWSDYVGDRRPTCVFECSVCDRRGHETRCFFTGDQVLCVECVRDVVIRCNTGRQAEEPTFTCRMLVELLTLDTIPYWRRTEEAQRWLSLEREVRALRRSDIGAVDEPVRERWDLALRPVTSRLAVWQESSDDREAATLEVKLQTVLHEILKEEP
jgi:hypothetical protein